MYQIARRWFSQGWIHTGRLRGSGNCDLRIQMCVQSLLELLLIVHRKLYWSSSEENFRYMEIGGQMESEESVS